MTRSSRPGRRRPALRDAVVSAPRDAGWARKGHEDPRTCSDTVHVGSACWLAGSPNYGTFGMMLSLCRESSRTIRADADVTSPTDFLAQGKTLQRLQDVRLQRRPRGPSWPGTRAVEPAGAGSDCFYP